MGLQPIRSRRGRASPVPLGAPPRARRRGWRGGRRVLERHPPPARLGVRRSSRHVLRRHPTLVHSRGQRRRRHFLQRSRRFRVAPTPPLRCRGILHILATVAGQSRCASPGRKSRCTDSRRLMAGCWRVPERGRAHISSRRPRRGLGPKRSCRRLGPRASGFHTIKELRGRIRHPNRHAHVRRARSVRPGQTDGRPCAGLGGQTGRILVICDCDRLKRTFELVEV